MLTILFGITTTLPLMADAEEKAVVPEKPLVSEDGNDRIMLQDGVAVMSSRDGPTNEFEEWRRCEYKKPAVQLQKLILVFKSKKGGTVEYSIVPDLQAGTFTGNVSYEE